MFKEILSIAGKPGLFKLVSNSKTFSIVESLIDGKRSPSYQNEKLSLLRDIIMYGTSEEKHLHELFKVAHELNKGERIDIDLKDNATIQEFFASIFPDFDRERIYPNDIKKFISWYNLLISKGITNFEIEETSSESKDKEVEKETKKLNKTKSIVAKPAQKVSTKSVAAKQSTRVAVKKGS